MPPYWGAAPTPTDPSLPATTGLVCGDWDLPDNEDELELPFAGFPGPKPILEAPLGPDINDTYAKTVAAISRQVLTDAIRHREENEYAHLSNAEVVWDKFLDVRRACRYHQGQQTVSPRPIARAPAPPQPVVPVLPRPYAPRRLTLVSPEEMGSAWESSGDDLLNLTTRVRLSRRHVRARRLAIEEPDEDGFIVPASPGPAAPSHHQPIPAAPVEEILETIVMALPWSRDEIPDLDDWLEPLSEMEEIPDLDDWLEPYSD
ncbi:hypothetical protein B0T18DRAFT_459159 [Schizothecium vesticola]|uniref:Uncharacterized protein n=1 Tax=Schizothecium vesticola TaxID=314040 RepID=A0AA40F763_9PEZI|nr:hypothetical protein B0T18DRAFT_459159 [Schizothecium vesticola]